MHTSPGHIAVGWLVVEDLFTVLLLVLLPVLFAPDSTGGASWVDVVLAVLKLVLLVALVMLLGGRLLPWLLRVVAGTRSRELFTLAVLAIVLGIAVGSARIFGASMALGAFLAGMALGRSEFSLRAATEAMPMRDAFAVLFFVAVGMLFDPKYLWEAPGLVAATLLIIMVGKPVSAYVIVKLLGHPTRTAFLSQVAELRSKGADAVFSSEGEIAITMTEFLLRKLGASGEQIDRERHRIRERLLSGSVMQDMSLLKKAAPPPKETP